MEFTTHLFMPGHTIDAVIKLKAGRRLSREELEVLRARFNELNNSALPKAGQTFKIPLATDTDPTRPQSASQP